MPAARPLMFVILSAHGETNPVARGHHDGCRPDLDIKLNDFSGGEPLFFIVGVIRPVCRAQFMIELSMRGPEPALADRSVRIDGALEYDLLPGRREDTKHHEDVRVRC